MDQGGTRATLPPRRTRRRKARASTSAPPRPSPSEEQIFLNKRILIRRNEADFGGYLRGMQAILEIFLLSDLIKLVGIRIKREDC